MASLETARDILRRLECAGFQAVLVGGCVRDMLLGGNVWDYDIATSALPQQVMALFPRCVATGLAHGTVTAVLGDGNYEITTFRTDGAYLDGRRPQAVYFVPQLDADLSRRDFTINAMAMDLAGKLYDPHGGRQDLQRRRIACVGDGKIRFAEDALRMLRALRFSSQLGFEIAPETWQALASTSPLCRRLSAQRVRDEVEKTLCSPRPEVVGQMLSLGLLAAVRLQGEYDVTGLSNLPPGRFVRWAGFAQRVHDANLRDFCLDNRTIALCQGAIAAFLPNPTDFQWKKIAQDYGWDTALLVGQLNGKLSQIQEIRGENPCVSLRQLAVGGRDFPHLKGKAVGRTLATLLTHVLSHPEDNKKETLLCLAEREEQV